MLSIIKNFISNKKRNNKQNNNKQNNLKYTRNKYGFFSLEDKEK